MQAKLNEACVEIMQTYSNMLDTDDIEEVIQTFESMAECCRLSMKYIKIAEFISEDPKNAPVRGATLIRMIKSTLKGIAEETKSEASEGSEESGSSEGEEGDSEEEQSDASEEVEVVARPKRAVLQANVRNKRNRDESQVPAAPTNTSVEAQPTTID